MEPNPKFGKLADDNSISHTVEALKKNGITAFVVNNKEEAKKKVLELIPKGSEVMTMTSMTLEAIGIPQILNESGNYNSVRKKLMSMDRTKQASEMNRLGAAHEFVVGSVHAVTEDGSALIASNTGSQQGSYAYGAGKVIWVVGSQKIVKNFDEGLKRLYEYALPLEDQRARKVYGVGSGVNKMLVVNKEVQPDRIFMIIVKEKLGF